MDLPLRYVWEHLRPICQFILLFQLTLSSLPAYLGKQCLASSTGYMILVTDISNLYRDLEGYAHDVCVCISVCTCVHAHTYIHNAACVNAYSYPEPGTKTTCF